MPTTAVGAFLVTSGTTGTSITTWRVVGQSVATIAGRRNGCIVFVRRFRAAHQHRDHLEVLLRARIVDAGRLSAR
uniref:Putative secreted peptide n=1 Tax=Anopheles braziliensis TaxID=58242 RepID=A0A2M3ZSL1_9DIPT